MAKLVNSGLHTLKSLFGESVYDFSQELQRLRKQLPILRQTCKSTKRNIRGGLTTCCFLFAALRHLQYPSA